MKRCVGEHVSPTREKGKRKGARRRAELDGAHSLGRWCGKGLERRERKEGIESDPSWLAERELRWARKPLGGRGVCCGGLSGGMFR